MPSDDLHMRRSLELARAGVGLVSPNPAVGAVVVDTEGKEVGSGTHIYEGIKHAEVLALEQAGERARGGTLCVNLEPCSHQGRTGPCADAIIAAGIRRVVCSMEDPNPRVAGQGFRKLRDAGIAVEVGQFAVEAKKLNEQFAVYIRHGRPFVTLKSAMSLDGKIAHSANAAADGTRQWITGEAARADVQRLRHEHDAILVGIGTVLADNPLLTDRSGLPRRQRLLRVVLDSHLRIPLDSRLVESAKDDLLIVYSSAEDEKKRDLERKGIRLEQIPEGSAGRIEFPQLLDRLGEMEITSLLIEGGARVNGTALASGKVDKIFLYFAPKIFGEGVPFACGPSTEAVLLPRNLKSVEFHQFGVDFAVEGYLRDPYDKQFSDEG